MVRVGLGRRVAEHRPRALQLNRILAQHFVQPALARGCRLHGTEAALPLGRAAFAPDDGARSEHFKEQ